MTKHGLFSFHIVDESPWPIMLSIGVFSCAIVLLDAVVLGHFDSMKVVIALMYCASCFFGWARDVSSEGSFQGMHTFLVQSGLKMGFALFILSEIMFFSSIFWAIFYFMVSPNETLGGWPCAGISMMSPTGAPLMGTMLLLASGFSVSWSHYSMMWGVSKFQVALPLAVTIVLGLTFSLIQWAEYIESSFTISDSVLGSVFFLSTGFHGVHVIIGSIYLTVCLLRVMSNKVSSGHHLGFEFAIWYWHFVDAVWMLLFVSMYL